MLRASITVVTALAASLVVAGGAFAAAPEVSSNWSGYVAAAPDGAATSFSDVTGTWVQPKATCGSGRVDAAAFWVGLGGNDAVLACARAARHERLLRRKHATRRPTRRGGRSCPPPPSRSRSRSGPGDRINAAVLVNGQTVTMSLKDLTRHTRFSKTMTVTQPLDVSSAEWIAEAPSNCSPSGHCRPVPLTRFGNVTFTNAAAIGNTHPGTITDPTWATDGDRADRRQRPDGAVPRDRRPARVGRRRGAERPVRRRTLVQRLVAVEPLG